jgi:hypothetical protein
MHYFNETKKYFFQFLWLNGPKSVSLHLTKSLHLSPFLHSLNQEYKDLKRKLQKVTDLLTEYNSDLIEEVTYPSEVSTAPPEEDTIVDNNPKLPTQSIKSLAEDISATFDQSIHLSKQVQIPSDVIPNVTEYATSTPKFIENNTPVNIVPLGFEYPITGTWKDKIFYALRVNGRPTKAAEIAAFMQKFEPAEKVNHVLSMVRQYTCNLAKDGNLGVESLGRSNLYFLKS